MAPLTLHISSDHTSVVRGGGSAHPGKGSGHKELLGSAMQALMKSGTDDGPGSPPDPQDESLKGLLVLSRGTSIILLLVYIAYLHFQVGREVMAALMVID